ncbi:MAG: DNA primase [Bacteriovoracia bacterium]
MVLSDFVKKVKEVANIVEVVGEYVRLRKSGSSYSGLCPFHSERSPSFSVSETKSVYHCFGCQKGGDVLSFIQEIHGVNFNEALRILCAKYSIQIPPEFSKLKAGSNQKTDQLEVLYKLNRFVAQFFYENLQLDRSQTAREYLDKRKISAQTVREFYLGYANDAWADLYDFLKSKKAPIETAEALGLIRKKSTGADMTGREHFDLFRNRIVFPLFDTRGRIVAFGGRSVQDESPKYLNSPESQIFKKGSQVFGLFQAQKNIREEDSCILVEGYMDCLAMHQAGFGNVVATLGTALTPDQIQLIKRFTQNFICLFDGDSAGKQAQDRAMELFLEQGVVARGVDLPNDCDPDEFIAESGPDALKNLLSSAPVLLDKRILELVTEAGGQTDKKAKALDKALEWISKLEVETARMIRLQEISTLFDVELPSSARVLNNQNQRNYLKKQQNTSYKRTGSSSRKLTDPVDSKLLEMLIGHPEFINEIKEREQILSGVETSAVRVVLNRIFSLFDEGKTNWDSILLAPDFQKEIQTDDFGLPEIISRALLLAEQDEQNQDRENLKVERKKELEGLKVKLACRSLEKQRDQLRLKIKRAETSSDVIGFQTLMKEYNELVRKISETKGGLNSV